MPALVDRGHRRPAGVGAVPRACPPWNAAIAAPPTGAPTSRPASRRGRGSPPCLPPRGPRSSPSRRGRGRTPCLPPWTAVIAVPTTGAHRGAPLRPAPRPAGVGAGPCACPRGPRSSPPRRGRGSPPCLPPRGPRSSPSRRRAPTGGAPTFTAPVIWNPDMPPTAHRTQGVFPWKYRGTLPCAASVVPSMVSASPSKAQVSDNNNNEPSCKQTPVGGPRSA